MATRSEQKEVDVKTAEVKIMLEENKGLVLTKSTPLANAEWVNPMAPWDGERKRKQKKQGRRMSINMRSKQTGEQILCKSEDANRFLLNTESRSMQMWDLGTMIALVLMLVGARGADAQTSARLSGMCQSFGYMLAATGPVLFGALHDWLQDWQIPLLVRIRVRRSRVEASRSGPGRRALRLDP